MYAIRSYYEVTIRKVGTRIGIEYFTRYPKKLGISTPASSAIVQQSGPAVVNISVTP